MDLRPWARTGLGRVTGHIAAAGSNLVSSTHRDRHDGLARYACSKLTLHMFRATQAPAPRFIEADGRVAGRRPAALGADDLQHAGHGELNAARGGSNPVPATACRYVGPLEAPTCAPIPRRLAHQEAPRPRFMPAAPRHGDGNLKTARFCAVTGCLAAPAPGDISDKTGPRRCAYRLARAGCRRRSCSR